MKPFEEKIVKLTLDYNTFKASASSAVGILGKLKDSITALGKGDASGAADSIREIADATGVVDTGLQGLQTATKRTSLAFEALKTMATGALLGIGNQLATSVLSTIKKFTIAPIMDGFKEYELKMKSMQTIMTNSGESISVVNKILDDLNKYSDLTIYNFNDMTQAIGSLSTAGVDLHAASSAVKGFFNLAAGTGVEAARASGLLDTAMVQAIQLGKMDYQNWRQLSSAGMGGAKFRDALISNAQAMGKQIDLSNGFNESLRQGWATTDVMLATLKQFENDQSLLDAATNVRTFTQLMGTALESVGSGWARSWEIIFGGFDEATTLWSGVWRTLEPILVSVDDLRNGFLLIFKESGGFKVISQSIGNVYRFIKQIVDAIGSGFTGSAGHLMEFLKAIPKVLTLPFKLIELITRKIADLKVIPMVIGAIFKTLFSVVGLVASAIFGVVKAITNVYNWVIKVTTAFKDWIKAIPTKGLAAPFIAIKDALDGILIDPLVNGFKLLLKMFTAIGDTISNLSLEPLKDWAKNSSKVMVETFKTAGENIKKLFSVDFWKDIWKGFNKGLEDATNTIVNSGPIQGMIKEFERLKKSISEFRLPNMDDIKNFYDTLKKSVTNFKLPSLSGLTDVFSGIKVGSIGDMFKTVTVHAEELGTKAKESAMNIKYVPEMLERIKQVASDFKATATDKVTQALDFMKDKFEQVEVSVQGFLNRFSKDNVVATVNTWIDALVEFNSGLDWSPILRQIQDVKDAFQSFKDRVSFYFDFLSRLDAFKIIQNGIQFIIDLIGTFNKTNINNTITNSLKTLGDITDSTKSRMESFGEFMKKVFSKLGDWAVLGVQYTIQGLGMLWEGLKSVISKVAESIVGYQTNLENFKKFVSEWAGKIKEFFGDALSTENLVKGGILTYIGLLIKGLFDFQKKGNGIMDGVKKMFENFGKFPEMIKELVEALTGLKDGISSKDVLTVAAAIGVLALSVKLLSTIEGEKVKTVLGLVATAVGSMLAVFAGIGAADKFGVGGGTVKSIAAITSIATALLIMAGALKVFASIDPESMGIAIIGLSTTMGVMVGAMVILAKMNAAKISISLKGIMGVATTILILAEAVSKFAEIPTDDLLKGGAAVAYSLAAVSIALAVMGKNPFGASAGIGIMAVALAIKMLVKPIQTLGSMSLGELAKGLLGLGGMLAAITVPLLVLSNPAISSVKLMGAGIAMNIVAGALSLMMIPMAIMANMDTGKLVQGLTGVGYILGVVAIALGVLSMNAGGALMGAGSILLVAAAINALIVPITIFGTLDTSTIAQGLIVIAGGIGLIIAAGYLATGAIPGLLAISAAIGAIAIGGIAIGGALMAVVVVLEFFTTSTKDSFDKLGENLVHMMDSIQKTLPRFEEFAIAIVDTIATVIDTNTGRIVDMVVSVLLQILTAIRDNIYKITDTALEIVANFLQAIEDNIYRIYDKGIGIMLEIVRAITDNLDPVIQAAVELVIEFINGMATALDEHSETFVNAIKRLIGGVLILIIEGLEGIVTTMFAKIPAIANWAEEAGDKATQGVRDTFNMETGKKTSEDAIDGLNLGMTGKAGETKSAAESIADTANTGLGSADTHSTGSSSTTKFLDGLESNEGLIGGAGRRIGNTLNTGLQDPNFTGTGTDSMSDYLGGIDSQSYNAEISGQNLAYSAKGGLDNVDTQSSGEGFGQGFINGIGNMWNSAVETARDLGASAVAWLNKGTDSRSPSRLSTQTGEWFGQGLINGIRNLSDRVNDTAFKMGSNAVVALNGATDQFKPAFESALMENLNLSPIITPTLDMSNIKMEEFARTFKAFSNNKIEGSDVIAKNSTEGKIGNTYQYDLHIHAQGELPDNVIDRMAVRFDQAIKRMNDRYDLNTGEVY